MREGISTQAELHTVHLQKQGGERQYKVSSKGETQGYRVLTERNVKLYFIDGIGYNYHGLIYVIPQIRQLWLSYHSSEHCKM